MKTLFSHLQLMPYGVDMPTFADIRIERQTRGGLEIACACPCAAIDLRSLTPLTLNNTRYDLDGMPDLSESGGSEAAYVRDLIKRQCRPWDPQSHRLVDSYFASLEAILQTHAAELKDRLMAFDGLFDHRQWLFSAPRPFPRSHVFAPAEAQPSLELDPQDFVAVDFAFFLGSQIVAMLPARSGLTPRKERERADRLARAGVRIAIFEPADLADNAVEFFTRALTPRLPAFWDLDPIPVGPFRPAAMEE